MLKRAATIFLIGLISLLGGCSLAEWEEISESESKYILTSNFVHIEEMEIISGQSFCADIIDGDNCDVESDYQIIFTLPGTMAPADWLLSLATQASDITNRTFTKNSEYYYWRNSQYGRKEIIEYFPNNETYRFQSKYED